MSKVNVLYLMLRVYIFPAKEYELHVTYKDYLRILQGGNFINIVCMVYDQKNKKSLIKFENLRLKVLHKLYISYIMEDI